MLRGSCRLYYVTPQSHPLKLAARRFATRRRRGASSDGTEVLRSAKAGSLEAEALKRPRPECNQLGGVDEAGEVHVDAARQAGLLAVVLLHGCIGYVWRRGTAVPLCC